MSLHRADVSQPVAVAERDESARRLGEIPGSAPRWRHIVVDHCSEEIGATDAIVGREVVVTDGLDLLVGRDVELPASVGRGLVGGGGIVKLPEQPGSGGGRAASRCVVPRGRARADRSRAGSASRSEAGTRAEGRLVNSRHRRISAPPRTQLRGRAAVRPPHCVVEPAGTPGSPTPAPRR